MKKIYPESKDHWLALRSKNISSTESSALFKASPYIGPFELWHRKKDGLVVEIESNERMVWGNRLERVIAEGIAEDQGWDVRKMNEYVVDEDIRMGASFDFGIGKEGILEVKNVDSLAFRNGWLLGDDNSVEAPPHIEIQVQHQLALSGRKFAYIGALVGGNTVHLLKREPDEKIIIKIRTEVEKFWTSIEKNSPPPMSTLNDAEFAISMMNSCEEGKTLDVRGDEFINQLIEDYKRTQESMKLLESDKIILKAKIMEKIGSFEKVKGDSFSISLGMTKECQMNYLRKEFRNFRIFHKKDG